MVARQKHNRQPALLVIALKRWWSLPPLLVGHLIEVGVLSAHQERPILVCIDTWQTKKRACACGLCVDRSVRSGSVWVLNVRHRGTAVGNWDRGTLARRKTGGNYFSMSYKVVRVQ